MLCLWSWGVPVCWHAFGVCDSFCATPIPVSWVIVARQQHDPWGGLSSASGMSRHVTGTLGFFNVALDHMRCVVVRGEQLGCAYLYGLLGGVWVVPLGAVALVRRLAMGEPFGAICCGAKACEDVALLRFGDVGVSRCPRPPPLPPPRGVKLRRPRSALDSKVTISSWEN